jgi:hypothetical protein
MTDPVVATSDKCIRYWPRRTKLLKITQPLRRHLPWLVRWEGLELSSRIHHPAAIKSRPGFAFEALSKECERVRLRHPEIVNALVPVPAGSQQRLVSKATMNEPRKAKEHEVIAPTGDGSKLLRLGHLLLSHD